MDSTSNKVVAVVALLVLAVGAGVLLILRRENERLSQLNQQLEQNQTANLKDQGTGNLVLGGTSTLLSLFPLIF